MESRDGSPPTQDSAGGRRALLRAVREELVECGHAAVSLRAVARRAGLSHAAPKHHFTDRAGMLTAAATEGFTELAAALRAADAAAGGADGAGRLAVLGQVYLEFGLANPALFDLMFRPSELTADDPALRAASAAAIGVLAAAVAPAGADAATGGGPPGVPTLALLSWVFVHGLVVLTGDGALATATGSGPSAAADLARALTREFARRVG